jgi:hypothetical protein
MGDLRGHFDCGQLRLFLYRRRLQLGETLDGGKPESWCFCAAAAGQPGTRRPTTFRDRVLPPLPGDLADRQVAPRSGAGLADGSGSLETLGLLRSQVSGAGSG